MKTLEIYLKTSSLIFFILLLHNLYGQQDKIYFKSSANPNLSAVKSGELLFDQMYNPGTGYIVSQHFTDPGSSDNVCAAADDFDIPAGETWDIYSIGIFGAYWTGNIGGGDTLNVFILYDNNGIPGDTVVEYLNHTDLNIVEEIVGNDIFTYFEIYLPDPVSLDEGKFWLSVQMVADMNTVGQWGWRDHVYEGAINGEEWHWINQEDGFGIGAINWTPANVVVGPWLLWELSFGLFGEPAMDDLSLQSITSPQEVYNEPQTDPVPVTVLIKNEGENTQTGFDMKYVVNGLEVIENVGSLTILSNEVYEFTFAQGLNLSSPGMYDLTVSTLLPGDENPENDFKSRSITVYDPTVYTMPSMVTSSITACSGTFTDAGGLGGNLIADDWGILTIYPANAGTKTRLEFLEFSIGWSEFWIYDGEDVNAPLLGFYENYDNPGTVTATYPNSSGALTIHFIAQTWTPFEKPGWAANINCYEPAEDDFAVLDLEIANPVVSAGEFVTLSAMVQNTGTLVQAKDVTFSANGLPFATVSTQEVTQSEIVSVSTLWNPGAAGDYILSASVPQDQGPDNNDTAFIDQEVFSEAYFYEGFELPLFPPDGWTQTSALWTRNTFTPYEGNGHAWFWGEPNMTDTLISPLLHIETGAVIRFFAYSSAWWPGAMDLCWIDGETGDVQLIEELSLSWMNYSMHEIDVSQAAGNNYLAWIGKWNPMGGFGELRLDNVEGITGIQWHRYDKDIKAYSLHGNITPEMNVPTSYSVQVKNLGNLPVAGSDYWIRMMQEPGIELTSVAGVDLLPQQWTTITLEYSFPYSGLKTVYADFDYPDDEEPSNNESQHLNLYVQQAGTIPVTIAEEQNYGENYWHPINLASRTISQTIYLGEDIGEPNTISGIMYYYNYAMNYPVFDIPLKLWFTETDVLNMADSMFSVADTALVFEGTIDLYPGENGVYIPLDFPFAYTGSNLVVTAFKPDFEYYGENYWQYSNSEEVRVRYYNGFDAIDPQNLPVLWHTWKNEYANITFYKYNPTGLYCVPQTLNGTINGDYIDGVTFNTITNISTGMQGGPSYHDYSSISTNVERSRYYPLTIDVASGGTHGSVAAWIDFNADGDMDDVGERVVHIKNFGSTQNITVPVLIPENATLGLTLLRVRNSADTLLFGSCETVEYGETEDYGINIVETQQVHNPAGNFTASVDNNGFADLQWEIPENPSSAMVEGFEYDSWPPQNGWIVKTSTTLDGPLSDPIGTTWGKSEQFAYNGSFGALCPADAPDFNWLISPEIQVFQNGQVQFMLHYQSDPMGYSKFYVRAEINGTWTTLLAYTDETTVANTYEQIVSINTGELAGHAVRFAFISEFNDAYPIAVDDLFILGVPSGFLNIDALLGYEIIRNGELLAEITNPDSVSYVDQLSITDNYEYCIQAVYETGNSGTSCSTVFYFAPLTPPLNVFAKVIDDQDVSVRWNAPNEAVDRFSDDFEDYTSGEQVACQNPEGWTTWTLDPCSVSDPLISDEQAYSGEQSVVIEGVADLMRIENELYDEGKFAIHFRLYIPEGYNGYFNVLQDHDLQLGALWGFQAFFDQNGYGEIDAGGYGAASFNYEYDSWMYITVMVDLDTDWAEFLIEDELIHGWQWSTGYGGSGGWNTLEAVSFYAWSQNGTPKFFIDDFQLLQLYETEDFLSYNIYRNDELISNTTELHYYDSDLTSGLYNYCITAVYDEGESTEACDWVSFYEAPDNFSAELINENDVYCSWDEISSGDLLAYTVYRDDQPVSVVVDPEWIDQDVEGGTHTYYVIAEYATGSSGPSNNATIIILIAPANLVAVPSGEDIELHWESAGNVSSSELIKLYQHDNIPVNGLYQIFENGYGVVFDLSSYSAITLETVDFHHASWGVFGVWDYKFHIIDWNSLTVLAELGPFSTSGDDTWEYEIPLGSLSIETNQVGIFLEPLGNVANDAYPVLSADAVLEGWSLVVDLNDLSQQTASVGDFILDLWIDAEEGDQSFKAPISSKSNTGNPSARDAYSPVSGFSMKGNALKGSKDLNGYNIYYAYEEAPFGLIDFTTDTTYIHYGLSTIPGLHRYFVTSVFDEGESDSSNIASVLISGLEETDSERVSIYPNPVNDLLYVEYTMPVQQLTILNGRGQQVYSKTGVMPGTLSIDLNIQPAGIYVVRLETPRKVINRKIIKH